MSRVVEVENLPFVCIYCDETYDAKSIIECEEVMNKHVRTCKKHPMRIVEHKADRLKAMLQNVVAGNWSVTEIQELLLEV